MAYPKDTLDACGPVKPATCFVIMPFAERFDSIYRRIRQTLAEEPVYIDCVRGDDIRRSNIIDTIVRSIAESEYIIADLTGSNEGLNANVFYEVGITHSIKDADKVLLISQNVDELPFDIRQLRCVEYRPSASGMKALKRELQQTFDVPRNAYRFRLSEGESLTLSERITGRERNLFRLTFTFAFSGSDGIKVRTIYEEVSFDELASDGHYQENYIGRGHRVELEIVPWTLQLVESGRSAASLLLERNLLRFE